MQKIRHIFIIILLLLLHACASTVQITSVVEKNKDGDFLVKWEVSPDQEGKIDIYSSASDSSLADFVPVKSSRIEDQFALFTPSGFGVREYFLLKTAGTTSGIVANRLIDMDNIKNFRDIGGYFNVNGEQVRWGKIYRSGDLSSANLFDLEKMKKLEIKTVIDFRSKENAAMHPYLLSSGIRKISLPMSMGEDTLNRKIEDGSFTRSDAIRYMQDMYIGIVENYKKEFSEMFNILCDENNYPVLLSEA
ncbi:MAG: tyrosine-protein phosphatase, partial [Bacteroidales bacterium]|nr:tyrosine-protein phosphatase [Bacteroidales bacterium]